MPERKPFSVTRDISEIAKRLSEKVGVEVKTAPQVIHERILVDVPPLDWLIEGIPLRAITTIYGPDSSGKTTFAALVARKFQQLGGIVVWVDTEMSFSPEYFSKLGVDPNAVLYVSGTTVEEVFELFSVVAEESLKDNLTYLAVWDSIAATPSSEEEQADFDERRMASSARATSVGLRKLSIQLAKFPKVSYLVISQVREDINNPYSTTGYSSYGGWALKHYQILSLEFRKIGKIEEGGKATGIKSRIIIAKSKLPGANLFRSVDIYFRYGEGIDVGASLLDIAKDCGYVRVEGGWYKLRDVQKSFRQEDIKAELMKEPHLTNLRNLWYEKNKGKILEVSENGQNS